MSHDHLFFKYLSDFNDSSNNNYDRKRKFKSGVNGRWTKDEHKKFLNAIQLYGKNWKRV